MNLRRSLDPTSYIVQGDFYEELPGYGTASLRDLLLHTVDHVILDTNVLALHVRVFQDLLSYVLDPAHRIDFVRKELNDFMVN